MAMSIELEKAARDLSGSGADRSEAVEELLRLADGRRVPLIMARQHLCLEPVGEINTPAVALIEEALVRLGTD